MLVVVILVSVAVIEYQMSVQDYGREIVVSFSRVALRYDYSCNEPVYGLYITVLNNGSKAVSNFNVSVSNALCVGALPALASVLMPFHSIKFYAYSSSANGTLIISGNNTFVAVSF